MEQLTIVYSALILYAIVRNQHFYPYPYLGTFTDISLSAVGNPHRQHRPAGLSIASSPRRTGDTETMAHHPGVNVRRVRISCRTFSVPQCVLLTMFAQARDVTIVLTLTNQPVFSGVDARERAHYPSRQVA
jgi:hypothetical protein